MKKDNKIVFVLVLLTALVGGGITVAIKIGLKEIPPFVFTFLRFGIAFIGILPILIIKKEKINKKYLSKAFLVSIFGTLDVVFFALGIKYTTATIGQILFTAVPILAVILSFLILSERISVSKTLGVFLGFFGTFLIIFLPLIGKPSPFKGSLYGNLIVMLAVISYSLYIVLSKKIQKFFSPIFLTAVLMFTDLFSSLVLMLFNRTTYSGWWLHLSLNSIIAILYAGIFGGLIYYLLYQYTIKLGSPVIASMILYLQPIATFIWAALLLKEQLTSGLIVGAILILSGAWMVTKAK